jgi:hypothetical protein
VVKLRNTDDGRRGGCLYLVGGVVLLLASVVLVVLLREPAFDSWGPYLATRTAWQRAGIGLAVGVAAAAPLLLLRISTRWWMAAPLAFYGFTAWVHLTLTWLPPGRAGAQSRAPAREFRADADWYIVSSVLAFHLAIPLVIWLALRTRASAEPKS